MHIVVGAKQEVEILHFCKPLQFMKRSIYVLVVEDQKSINDMHDYTMEEGILEAKTECYAKEKVKSLPFFDHFTTISSH